MRPLLLLVALPLWAADDVHAILQRVVEAEKANAQRAGQYAFVEDIDHFTYDKTGKPKKESSETHEIIFVEGLEYKKLVARNGKPLVPREQAKEEKKLRQTAEERRKQRRSGLFHKTVSTGSDEDLLTLFDSRLLGEEEIRGRRAWIVECVPQAGRVPASDHEKQVLSFRKKLWIDEAENVYVKTIDTVVGDRTTFKPGTVVTWEYGKINEDAWLPVSVVLDAHLQFAKFIKPWVRAEQRYSNFKKFDVQSTITADPGK